MRDEETLKADAELLRLTGAGSRDDFAIFLGRHEAAVMRYLRALLPDEMIAADVFQETFIAAWRHAADFRGTGSARAWLMGIARNSAHRQFRRRAGQPVRMESLDELAEKAGWGSNDRIAERLEAADLVESALSLLAPEDREVLVLRDVEGYTGDEVAAMLDLTVTAMKSRLHRARLRFMANVREAH